MVYNAILKKHFEKLGFDNAFMNIYESKASDEMQNVDRMCDCLHKAYVDQAHVVIYTDFDVDGIMSSVIAYAGMSELSLNVSLFKPTPADGYGFRIKDVDNIISEYPDVAVIFTGDVGTASNDAVLYARSKGIVVCVTDHHISNEASAADITVNPNQYGETYSHNNICGAYVVYKIIEEYSKRYCMPSKQADIYRLQVFAGIATVSDVMPLIYENRQLVRNSVAIARYFLGYELNNNTIAPPVYSDNYSRAFVGLKKLLEYFQQNKKIKVSDDITEQFYGFYLVPFLNSPKRMNGDMNGIYDIFFSQYVNILPDYENMACVEAGIRYVEALNNQRKLLTDDYFSKLIHEKEEQATDVSKYMNSEVYITDVLPGLCGLLATKFMSLSNMPTLVLNANADGSYSGSGRCPSWFDFSDNLERNNIRLICKGHKEAFGVFAEDKSALIEYIDFFQTVVLAAYNKALAENKFVFDTNIVITNVNTIKSDFAVDTELIRDYISEYELYHPYGHCFPEPRFTFAVDITDMDVIFFGNAMQHAKFITSNGIEILLFNQALDYELLKYNICDDKRRILICNGFFRYDSYDNDEYDTICFLCDSIDMTGVETA